MPDTNVLKRSLLRMLPDVGAIVLFVLISLAYFVGPVSKGLVLTGHDHSGGLGASSEMEAYRAAHHGERTRWTNTLFSGMPTYQMAPSYPSTDRLKGAEQVYRLFLPDYVVLVFIMLLGFYILLRAFNFRPLLASLGAIAWAFSSYYFIIIGAGHIWKFYTLAYIPPTIAGLVLCYRGRYAMGTVVTAFFMALQILSNHVQMTYYFGFVIALLVAAGLVEGLRQHRFTEWLKGTAAFAAGCLLGLAINASNLYHTWEYSKETMRAPSELTQKTKDPADQTSSGLERSYITAWSYGLGETWTLLVPNTKGGASVPLTDNATAMRHAQPMYTPVYQSLTQYWGDQPGTSGPVYVGALVCFLFVLGLFIVRGPVKWALLAATVLSITLAWGKNFMPWTDLFLDYVPMYDKFRTVSSILVIAEFTMPLLAMLALRELLLPAQAEATAARGTTLNSHTWRYFWAAAALTGGVAVLFALMPDLFFGHYTNASEQLMLQHAVDQGYIPQQMLAPIMDSVQEMRRAMFTADAWRSALIIAVGIAVIVALHFRKVKTWSAVGCLIVLCLADMWDVDKRYMNDSMFSRPQSTDAFFAKTRTDELILQDTDTYYRVANLAVNTFNDNTTSYWHKSIGGYHAAKLRRYQELIDAHLQPELMDLYAEVAECNGHLEDVNGDSIFPVLNALRMKYVIMPLQGGQTVPVPNPWAMPNAWMVDNIMQVSNADDELAALATADLRHTAVVDVTRFPAAAQLNTHADSTDAIRLTAYAPNALSYESSTKADGVAVFSDIYYPGWQCTIDGQRADILRADYVMRAIALPAGRHTIAFVFDPESLHTTEAVAGIAQLLLLLLAAFSIGLGVWQHRRKAAIAACAATEPHD